MQLFAIDENQQISAQRADKGKNYLCPECLSPVRVKQGEVRQSHFFHLQQNTRCRLCQKGEIHLRLQSFIKYLFPGAEIEKKYPEIGRIADVANERTKIIYEIQYSPISLEEALQRCADYESLGYQIVWILHDDAFNQGKMGEAEQFLRSKTCYYSNMNEEGNGAIYDQLEKVMGRNRVYISYRNQVSLRFPSRLPLFRWPKELALRANTWPLYHKGDLMDLALRKKFFPHHSKVKRSIWEKVKNLHSTMLYILLEKNSNP